MTEGETVVIAALDASGVSISKVHRSGSGFSPRRFDKGKPGRSKISASPGVALKGAMSTPTALMLEGGNVKWQCDKVSLEQTLMRKDLARQVSVT